MKTSTFNDSRGSEEDLPSISPLTLEESVKQPEIKIKRTQEKFLNQDRKLQKSQKSFNLAERKKKSNQMSLLINNKILSESEKAEAGNFPIMTPKFDQKADTEDEEIKIEIVPESYFQQSQKLGSFVKSSQHLSSCSLKHKLESKRKIRSFRCSSENEVSGCDCDILR